jgi:hypothetical protein
MVFIVAAGVQADVEDGHQMSKYNQLRSADANIGCRTEVRHILVSDKIPKI